MPATEEEAAASSQELSRAPAPASALAAPVCRSQAPNPAQRPHGPAAAQRTVAAGEVARPVGARCGAGAVACLHLCRHALYGGVGAGIPPRHVDLSGTAGRLQRGEGKAAAAAVQAGGHARQAANLAAAWQQLWADPAGGKPGSSSGGRRAPPAHQVDAAVPVVHVIHCGRPAGRAQVSGRRMHSAGRCRQRRPLQTVQVGCSAGRCRQGQPLVLPHPTAGGPGTC